MWVYTRRRHEHDPRFLINLDRYPSVSVNQLGERFFIDAGSGGETATLASTNSEEEAYEMVQHIFDAMETGKSALDLSLDPAAQPENKNGVAPHQEPQQAVPPKAITK